MRIAAAFGLGLVGSTLLSTAASAATIVVFTDPLTLDRKTVVVDPDGPDRAFHCMLPPATSGCQPIPIKRSRH